MHDRQMAGGPRTMSNAGSAPRAVSAPEESAGSADTGALSEPCLLEISLLGQHLVVTNSTEAVRLRSLRTVALLTYLVLHRGIPQRRGQVAGLFWPESTEGQARTNLRRELHVLRGALPHTDRWLSAESSTLLWRVDPNCRVDVAEFERAAAGALQAREAGDKSAFRAAASDAVRLYGGELVPGLYDDWLVSERDRLRHLCVVVLDHMVDTEQEVGGYAEGIDLARRRIELEPLEEVGYRRLLHVQRLAGDRAAAVRTYHQCVSVLERELGIGPDQATTLEYELLVGQAPQIRRATPRPVHRVSVQGRVPLIGRQREMQSLQQCWVDAADGRAEFAVVSGEAGVGKTRLLDELATIAQSTGAVIARARCFAAKDRLPLAPVSEWLRSPVLRAARGGLDAAWAHEVDRLVPPPGGSSLTRPRPMADAWQRHRFLEGLVWAVLVTGRPTLLILDDLQWCDEETAAWLQLLLRLGQRYPLLLLAASRVEEINDNPRVADLLQTARSAGVVTEVELEPLDAGQSAALASAILGSTTGVEPKKIYDATGGYPLFVIESARARRLGTLGAGSTGQLPRVKAVLTGRIRQASTAARDIAGLAAAIGRDFSLELLVEASELETRAVIDAVDELWHRRIVREHSVTNYDFTHDLLREAAYSELSAPRRTQYHRRVAWALEKLHPDDLERVSATLAEQYERAGQPQPAIEHHIRAAEAATAVFANKEAARHYRRAADLLLAHAAPGRERDTAEL